MRSIIDALEKALQEHPRLAGKHVEAYWPTDIIPDAMPFINIVPRGKSRERVYLIGAGEHLYNVSPDIELHVWEQSIESLREAFNDCEELAEDVLDILSEISASTLGVDYHESQIEAFQDENWEDSFYYVAVIVLSAKKDETHS